MIKYNVEFNILVKGTPITEYNKDGNILVEGRYDSEYTLRIINNNSYRILAVPSVDGLSVLDGQKASFDSHGYIIDPYQTINISGWRISDEQVRAFIFANSKQSYSNKVGEGTDNTGVIGLAVFKDKVKYKISSRDWYWTNPWGSVIFGDVYRSNSTKGLTSSTIGTGMGEKKESKVTKVGFDREKNPLATFSIFYYNRKELEKMGITIQKSSSSTANPFPGNEYCRQV